MIIHQTRTENSLHQQNTMKITFHTTLNTNNTLNNNTTNPKIKVEWKILEHTMSEE